MDIQQVKTIAVKLLRDYLEDSQLEIRQHPSGGNNRVYTAISGNRKFLLKAYFQHPLDQRNRLQAEYSFISFAWMNAVRFVPKPLAMSAESSVAAYEFIQGKQLTPREMERHHIDQMLDFFVTINNLSGKPDALTLNTASEACFSIEAYFANIEARLDRLNKIEPDDMVSKHALAFIKSELVPKWEEIKTTADRLIKETGLNPAEIIPINERCLSPSDFGFHNALLEEGGQLRLFDFEYAGWDDPAKTICDFFSQPEIPVPLEYAPFFLDRLKTGFGDMVKLKNRIRILFPVLRLKWCCIMLNEFLPVSSERRKYALKNEDRRKSQLELAGNYLKKTTESLIV